MVSNKRLRNKFGMAIRKLREQKGLSQEELALLCNVHRTYIGRVERGETNVTLETIAKIAQALKTPIHELFQNLGE